MQSARNTKVRFTEFYGEKQRQFIDEAWRFYPYSNPRGRIDPAHVVDEWNKDNDIVKTYGQLRCTRERVQNGDTLIITIVRRAANGEVVCFWRDQYGA